MSIWADIQDKSCGDTISKEDFSQIYNGESNQKELESGEYNNAKYSIKTSGFYPYISVTIDRPLSVFAGSKLVRLQINDEWVELERHSTGLLSNYVYTFNHNGDYYLGEHDGKKYNLDMLRSFAHTLIDKITKSEDDIKDRID